MRKNSIIGIIVLLIAIALIGGFIYAASITDNTTDNNTTVNATINNTTDTNNTTSNQSNVSTQDNSKSSNEVKTQAKDSSSSKVKTSTKDSGSSKKSSDEKYCKYCGGFHTKGNCPLYQYRNSEDYDSSKESKYYGEAYNNKELHDKYYSQEYK